MCKPRRQTESTSSRIAQQSPCEANRREHATDLFTRSWLKILFIKLILLGLFIYGANQDVDLVTRVKEIGIQPGLVVFALIWFMSLLAVVAVAFNPKRQVRLPWMILLLSFSLFSLSFQLITSKSLSLNDFERLIGLIGFSENVVNFYGRFLITAGIWSLLGAVALNIPPFTTFSSCGRTLQLLRHTSTLQIATILAISLILFSRGGQGEKGLPAQYTSIAFAAMLGAEKVISPPSSGRRAVILANNGHQPIRNVIMIMDESIRGDYVGINSHSNARAPLNLGGDALVNFGMASSQANCSAESNVSMRYGVTKANYLHDLKANPSIWEYAKKTGYSTTYIDGQRYDGNLQNFMDSAEISHINRFIQLDKNIKPDEKDHWIARSLRKIIAEPGAHFVYINKMGCHFPYEGKYPDTKKMFMPTMQQTYFGNHSDPKLLPQEWHAQLKQSDGFEAQERLRLVNSYKNCIAWNTDEFFDVLLKDLDLKDTVITYTSDHGQNLHDDGSKQGSTHCTTGQAVAGEGMVPLAVITRDPETLRKFHQAARFNYDRASLFNVFPTLLLFMGYKAEELAATGTFEPTLLQPLPDDNQRFLSTYFVRFGQKPVWNDIKPARPTGANGCCIDARPTR